MNENRRSRGLVILAVLNFLLGGLWAINALGLVAINVLAGNPEALASSPTPQQQAQFDAATAMGGSFLGLTIVNAVSAVLLIVSAIGFLKPSQFAGRTLGNGAALLFLASTAAIVVWMPVQLGGGLTMRVLINSIYSVLTLFLVNVTLKEALSQK